jgi:DNA-binding LacI/PurR family transcriptional regulator
MQSKDAKFLLLMTLLQGFLHDLPSGCKFVKLCSIGMMTQARATLNDIARVAKVSPSTVSRMIRGSASVGVAASRRIQQAAKDLGFDLNRNIQNKVITFVLGNRGVSHYFHSRVLAGAETFLSERGYNLLYLSYRYAQHTPKAQLEIPRVLRRRDLVSGLILAGTHTVDFLETIRLKGIPIVVFGNNVEGAWSQEDVDIVWSQYSRGTYETIRYLQAQGHRNIGFVGSTLDPWGQMCYAGYLEAMSAANLTPIKGEFEADSEEDLGYLSTKSLLGEGKSVTAIFAGQSEFVALGAYRALRDSSYQIPGDISVAGFNDTNSATMHPSLTSVDVFPEQIGRSLAELLVNRLKHPDLPQQQRHIPTRLTVRDSTVPKKAGIA